MALFEDLTVGKLHYDSFDTNTTSSAITAAKVDYTTGGLDTEAEMIAAINTTNGKINSIITALTKAGILA